MQHYLRAMVAFLRPLGMPVYTGKIPGGVSFPYATLSAAYAPFTQTAALTLTCWFREAEGHRRRIEVIDHLCAMIPDAGAMLRFTGGCATLHRASGDFARLVGDEADPRVLGGRVRLTVRCYDL